MLIINRRLNKTAWIEQSDNFTLGRKEGRKQVKIDFLAIVSLDRERCGYRE